MTFRLLSGTHHQENKAYTKGQTVESEHNLVELFPQKFALVGEPATPKGKKTWEDDDEGDGEDKPKHSAAKPSHPQHVAGRTMRDK